MHQQFRFAFLRVFLLAIGLAFFLPGCAVPYKFPHYQGHKTFTGGNINQLHVGMPAHQFRTIFGPPDVTYETTFGENVGEPWIGQVWLYFTKKDPRFRHVKRYKKNMFVFYASGGQKLLNHWTIEK